MTPADLASTAVTAAAVTGTASSHAVWYFTRGTGIVALLLLTASLLLGLVAQSRWRHAEWPRFASQRLHRSLSLLCVAFVALHVIGAVADGFAPIGWVSTVVPFTSSYRPLWTGLGAVALDLLLALIVTSLLRVRLGLRAWRLVHWAAYLCWPVAVAHGLGTGSDTGLVWAAVPTWVCVTVVALAVAVRAWRRPVNRPAVRLGAVAASLLVPLALGGFALAGPLRPGWAKRAGTPPRLTAAAVVSVPSTAAGASSAGSAALALPYQGSYRATVKRAQTGSSASVSLAGAVLGTPRLALSIVLTGLPLASGGVALTTSRVVLSGPGVDYVGTVTGLAGNQIQASLARPGAANVELTASLQLGADAAVGTVVVR